MKKIFPLLLFILILFFDVHSQPQKKGNGSNFSHFLFSEVHQVSSGTSNDLYYVFKLPFDRLVFEKSETRYQASFRFSIEVIDSDKNFVKRQIKEQNIFVNSFDETISGDLYYSGLIKFNLEKGNYYLIPVITDKNSGHERKLHEIFVQVKDLKDNNFLEPVVAYQTKTKCGNSQKYYIPNFNGNVPFDANSYDLIIPSPDLLLSNIFITLISNKDTILKKEISNSFIEEGGFAECGAHVILSDDKSPVKYKYFVLPGFNKNLAEGKLTIFVSRKDDSTSLKKFVKPVNWFNMPFSLRNPEFAIESLKYIEKEEKVIDSLLDLDEKNYRYSLFNYWKKYDPTPETSFNELMNEYYLRIDYAAKNFNSISGKPGFDSDRGKVFVKFGKPNKIERNSTGLGKIVETWIYEKPERKFIFVDERGTGEYQLKNGL